MQNSSSNDDTSFKECRCYVCYGDCRCIVELFSNHGNEVLHILKGGDEEDDSQDGTPPGSFRCPICLQEFESEEELLVHFQTHFEDDASHNQSMDSASPQPFVIGS